jgi:hypothetical protein
MLLQNFITTAIVLSGVLFIPIYAHPGEEEPTLTSRELDRRQAAINARHAVVRNCDGAIAAFEAQRRAKRSALIDKRHGNPPHHTTTKTAHEPKYTTLQNVSCCQNFIASFLYIICKTTCVLTPSSEILEGPFYIVRILKVLLEFIVSLMHIYVA